MKGDFSRLTYNPKDHYVAVLHQQGRVFLDSDWNADVLERLALLRRELTDVIGNCGVPEPGTAFEISPGIEPNDFQVAAGRCYVHGVLCRLESDTTYLSQPDFLDPPAITIPSAGSTAYGLVYLEVWHRLITYLEDDNVREIALNGPDTATRLKTISQVKILPLPNSLTDFGLANIIQFLPTPGAGTLTTLQPVPAQVQNLCQLPDPGNFTGRQNHLYRVQIHDGGEVIGGSLSARLAADATARTLTLKLANALNSNQVVAAKRAGIVTVTDNVTRPEVIALDGISSDGGTLTLAARLKGNYTTANNASVVLGSVAGFKWSRENASFAVRATVQSDRVTLTLASLGRDTVTALRQGDLVEISDDWSELSRARGHLTNLVADPDPDSLTVVLQDPLPAEFKVPGSSTSTPQADRHLLLRRWDGRGQASAVYGDTATPAMNLGDGIHIQFGGSDLRSGDYWQFTTRTADGSVEALTDAPPAGIVRHWCPLAVLRWAPPALHSPPLSPPFAVVVDRIADYRNPFPSLIHFPAVEPGIHITGVSIVDPSGTISLPLINDTEVQLNYFGRIDIQCDAAIDPSSISRPTCFLALESAQTDSKGNLSFYTAISPPGVASSSANIISWQPTSTTIALLIQLTSFVPPNDKGVLTRLTLKGNFIWDLATQTRYLDGDAFGIPGGGGSNTSLALPSGDKRRGGDFETWFWLVSAPPLPIEVAKISCDPNQIYPANTATTTFTITLSAAAPSTGLPITIHNSNPLLVTLTNPPTSVPAGLSSITFTGSAVGPKTNTGQATITAAVAVSPPDLYAMATTLTVLNVDLNTLTVNPESGQMNPGGRVTGTVNLTSQAPGGTPPITLTSSASEIASVQPSIVIPAGDTSSSQFLIIGHTLGSATITATLGGVKRTAPVTVVKP
jgi:hypothetical protein